MARRDRFTKKSDTTRIDLSDGDYIIVRDRLSGPESKRMMARAFTGISQGASGRDEDSKVDVDFAMLSLSRTHAYIVDWNFVKTEIENGVEKEVPVKLSFASIEALDEDTLAEIEKKLDAHIKAKEEEKKQTAG